MGPDQSRAERLAPAVEDTRVTIVIASRDRRDELVGSIAAHRAPVVLMDNASSDGSAEAVRHAHPSVEVVELPTNLGARARTLGVARARTPYVAFADDDSWWAPGSLRAAADLLDAHPDVAVVAARVLVGPEQRPDPFGEVLKGSPLGPDRPGGSGLLPGPRVLGFMACGAMVRREAFLQVGGFDPVVRFPGEEERVALDLVAAGHHLVHVETLTVHHHPSRRRHSPEARITAVTRSGLLTAVLRLPWPAVVARIRAALQGGPATRAGLRVAVRDLPAALRGRRVVPDEVLAALAVLARRPTAGSGTARTSDRGGTR